MKKVLFIVFLFFYGISCAQIQLRTEMEGNIKVPAGNDSEGITVFNKNANKGTVSDQQGNFSIPARKGDSIYFAALQFKELLVVVDEEIAGSQRLLVEITEGVNELPEVVLREHDLSGNIAADVKNIKVVPLDLPSFSAASIAQMYPDWYPASDGQSQVINTALGESGGGLVMAADPLAIISGLIRIVAPKRKKVVEEPQRYIGRIELEEIVRERYNDEFFLEVLKIEKTKISDFFDYCEENGFPRELLKEEKEMSLVEYLLEQSELFRTA
ncbi:MAG: hypothetical protein WBL21_07105 [Salinimicrobium sp.]